VCLHIWLWRQQLEKPHAINRPTGAGDANDELGRIVGWRAV
jgi:hypothetical protein